MRPHSCIVAFMILTSVTVRAVSAADWPTFRGADRTAVSKETGLLQEWPANGPPLIWKAEGNPYDSDSISALTFVSMRFRTSRN